jgi:LPXTG-site transpeptidase (sortase) family protein
MRRLLNLKWRLLPLVAAVFILALPLIDAQLSRHRVSSAADTARQRLSKPAKATLRGVPNRILIPSLDIDLPVISQSYSTILNSWPVAETTANYATETPQINNIKGQSLIYGHSSRDVFGPLLEAKPGAEAFVYTDNGHIFKYKYVGSINVTPDKTSIIKKMSEQPAGLNLITCDGDFYQYRRILNFSLTTAT